MAGFPTAFSDILWWLGYLALQKAASEEMVKDDFGPVRRKEAPLGLLLYDRPMDFLRRPQEEMVVSVFC